MSRFDISSETNPSPKLTLAGSLLIATQRQRDPLFANTVCLVIDDSDSNSAGIVLNRPFFSNTAEIWNELLKNSSIPASKPPKRIHFGGPVSGPVIAIHDQQNLADAGNNNGVYLAADGQKLEQLAGKDNAHYRLLIGHVEWETGELVNEIIEGYWYVMPAKSEIVFERDEYMWPQAIRHFGSSVISEFPGVSKLPQSSLAN